ncbi:MAG: DUF1836 domain-containing protein [Clostridia bacterium]|nr:DUF1836 domain-containing protein [Clostridia bacterium]
MNVYNNFIPGTTLDLEKSGGATGAEFLDKIFYISDGIMLSYIREISGIDGTTLQNWVKRGWVLNPVNKLYSKEQVARILIINMVRETMQLSKITYLLNYINGEVSDKSDDIISESKLYDYICRTVKEAKNNFGELETIISEVTSDYRDRFEGAGERLRNAIKIILLAYNASVFKASADIEMKAIEEKTNG